MHMILNVMYSIVIMFIILPETKPTHTTAPVIRATDINGLASV